MAMLAWNSMTAITATSNAPAEISRLTTEGVRTAESAGELLSKLVPDIQKTSELVREIAAASAEQSTGASQVNKAIQQLDQVIQQNSAASEEMASTAEELASQAEVLQSTIGFFRTSESECERQQRRRTKSPTAATSLAKMQRAVSDRGIAIDLKTNQGGGDAWDKNFVAMDS